MATVRGPALQPPSSNQLKITKGFLDIAALQKQELEYNQWANAVADKNTNLPPLGLLNAPPMQVEREGDDEREEEEEEEEGNPLTSDMDDDDESYSFNAHMIIADNPDDSHFLDASDDLQVDSDFDVNDLEEEPFPAVNSDNEEEQ